MNTMPNLVYLFCRFSYYQKTQRGGVRWCFKSDIRGTLLVSQKHCVHDLTSDLRPPFHCAFHRKCVCITYDVNKTDSPLTTSCQKASMCRASCDSFGLGGVCLCGHHFLFKEPKFGGSNRAPCAFHSCQAVCVCVLSPPSWNRENLMYSHNSQGFRSFTV